MGNMLKITPIIAIACIFTLELFSLSKGIDGKILALSVSAISGLGGFAVGRLLKKKGGGRNG